MAENAPVLIGGENSPEQIAYKLLITISENEKKSLHPSGAWPAAWQPQTANGFSTRTPNV